MLSNFCLKNSCKKFKVQTSGRCVMSFGYVGERLSSDYYGAEFLNPNEDAVFLF